MKGELKALEEGDLKRENLEKIAATLDVSEEEVINMNRRMSGSDSSLNAPLRADSESEWQDWLVDDTDNQEIVLANQEEMNERRKLLVASMEVLNERERKIIAARRLQEEPQTLEELSREYSISRERVRQIEVRAFEYLHPPPNERARLFRLKSCQPLVKPPAHPERGTLSTYNI